MDCSPSGSSAASFEYSFIHSRASPSTPIVIAATPSPAVLESPMLSNNSPVIMSQTLAHEIPVWHPTFNMRDEHIVLQAENVKFRVHGYFFERESDISRALIANRSSRNKFSDDPIILQDVKAIDLERFLSLLYPIDYETCSLVTKEEWSSVLSLSEKWGFRSLCTRAIKMLEPLTSALEKVVLGNQYRIVNWLPNAYLDLCERTEPLSDEEGEQLGLYDVLRIARAREHLRGAHIVATRCQRQDIVTSIFSAVLNRLHCGFSPVGVKPSFPAGSRHISASRTPQLSSAELVSEIPLAPMPENYIHSPNQLDKRSSLTDKTITSTVAVDDSIPCGTKDFTEEPKSLWNGVMIAATAIHELKSSVPPPSPPAFPSITMTCSSSEVPSGNSPTVPNIMDLPTNSQGILYATPPATSVVAVTKKAYSASGDGEEDYGGRPLIMNSSASVDELPVSKALSIYGDLFVPKKETTETYSGPLKKLKKKKGIQKVLNCAVDQCTDVDTPTSK